MRKTKSLALFFMLFSLFASIVFFGCSKPQPAPAAGGKTYNLTYASVGGSVYYFPAWLATEKGWFKDAGLELKEITFTNGPVMVEALASNGWDIGMSGIGGVLPGVIVYDAVLVGPNSDDDGTQFVFARNNSPIVAAGTGKNSIDSRIYGDVDSWKGKKVLCNTGAVLQYTLIKVLGGFGLTQNDVQFIAIDVATASAAFRAGEGDVVLLTGSAGSMQMDTEKDTYTRIASGPWAQTGLMANCYANKNSLADPEKREAILLFWDVYYKALDWIKNNSNTAIDLLVDYNAEMGTSLDRGSAEYYLTLDPYFTIQEGVDMMINKAPGKNHSVMEERLIGVLQFFIDTGSRQRGDVEKFVGHVDPSMMQEFLKRSK